MPELLPRLRQGVPVAMPNGDPTPEFILFWQQFCNAIETIPGLAELVEDAEAAAAAAQASADAAQSAADTTAAASSLENSYIVNYTPPLISADSTGTITIANHQRQYAGDPAPAPVSVSGATLPSAYVNPNEVRVYYDQPSRLGGAVTYQMTLDPTVAAQTGNRHSVGAVVIPAAGSQGGDPVRPPGYVSLL